MNSLTNSHNRCYPQPRPRIWPEPGTWPPAPPKGGGWPPNEPGIWPPNEPGIWPPRGGLPPQPPTEPGIWPPQPGVWPPKDVDPHRNDDCFVGQTFFSHGEIGIITPELVRRMRAGIGQE